MKEIEIAGDVINLIMSRTEKKGAEFTDECLGILTLCISEIIRSGFCPNHYEKALEKCMYLMKNDLKD